MKQIFLTAVLFLALPFSVSSQTDNKKSEDFRITALLEKVEAKSKSNRTAYLSEYERIFKLTIESENKNKISSRVFEQYCLNDGKPFCRTIEIERDGKPRSASKIQKERETVSKTLDKNENYVEKDDLFGYGATMNSIWIEPTLYLKSCRIVSSDKKQIEGRTAVLVRVDDCKLDAVYSKWARNLSFMPKTKAEILIDEKDESVMKMDVYAKEEFASANEKNNPIITLENVRMPEGFWLFKKIWLETAKNKTIFPNLKDNWQFDFYGYKRYEVEVKEAKTN